MEQEAKKRKARLELLKGKIDSSETTHNTRQQEREEEKVLVFRNYTPSNPSLGTVLPPKIGPTSDSTDTIEAKAKEIEQEALQETTEEKEELDLLDLAPKKPNWDLKRDLHKKLERLEVLTQIAIAEEIRKRLLATHDISAAASYQVPTLGQDD